MLESHQLTLPCKGSEILFFFNLAFWSHDCVTLTAIKAYETLMCTSTREILINLVSSFDYLYLIPRKGINLIRQRVRRIELLWLAWKASTQPLCHTRIIYLSIRVFVTIYGREQTIRKPCCYTQSVFKTVPDPVWFTLHKQNKNYSRPFTAIVIICWTVCLKSYA